MSKVGHLLAKAVQAHDAEVNTLQERIATLEAQLKESREELESVMDDMASQESALTEVKYWMHDVLVLNKPITSPRRILRIVEEAL